MDKNKVTDNLTDSLKDTRKERGGAYGSLLDKVRKLTGVLYKVTDLYTDKEPLKWTLRNNALDVYVSLMSVIHPGKMSVRAGSRIDEVLDSISLVCCSLELASIEGSVLGLNFDVLKKEYLSLKRFLEEERGGLFPERRYLLGPDFGFSFGNMAHPEAPTLESAPSSRKTGEGNLAEKRTNPAPDRFNERKNKIVSFLAGNGKKTVKEIASIFDGVSEKTVQRYLLDLVRSGKLAAKGEKRWRKYELV